MSPIFFSRTRLFWNRRRLETDLRNLLFLLWLQKKNVTYFSKRAERFELPTIPTLTFFNVDFLQRWNFRRYFSQRWIFSTYKLFDVEIFDDEFFNVEISDDTFFNAESFQRIKFSTLNFSTLNFSTLNFSTLKVFNVKSFRRWFFQRWIFQRWIFRASKTFFGPRKIARRRFP